MYSNKQCTVKPIWPERCQPWGVSKWDKGESFVVCFVQNRKMLVMMTTQIIVFKARWHARGANFEPLTKSRQRIQRGRKGYFTFQLEDDTYKLKGLTSVWYSILWKVATFQLIVPILKNRGTSAIELTSFVVESKLGAGVLSFCQAVWKIEKLKIVKPCDLWKLRTKSLRNLKLGQSGVLIGLRFQGLISFYCFLSFLSSLGWSWNRKKTVVRDQYRLCWLFKNSFGPWGRIAQGPIF